MIAGCRLYTETARAQIVIDPLGVLQGVVQIIVITAAKGGTVDSDLFVIDPFTSELRIAASSSDPMAIDYLSLIHFAISAIEDFRRIEIFLKKRFHVLSKRFAAQP